MKRYKTFKTFKKSGSKRTIETGLTLKEAQNKVAKDIQENPKCLTYMLCYTEK